MNEHFLKVNDRVDCAALSEYFSFERTTPGAPSLRAAADHLQTCRSCAELYEADFAMARALFEAPDVEPIRKFKIPTESPRPSWFALAALVFLSVGIVVFISRAVPPKAAPAPANTNIQIDRGEITIVRRTLGPGARTTICETVRCLQTYRGAAAVSGE